MAENKLADISTEFAVKILNVTNGIRGHYSLANQLERSGTIRRMLIVSINTAKENMK